MNDLVSYLEPAAVRSAPDLNRDELKQLLTTLKVMPIAEGVPLPNYHQFLDADGGFQPTEPVVAGSTTMLDELHRWSTALKPLRTV